MIRMKLIRIALIATLMLMGGCRAFWGGGPAGANKSSLVAFLYPNSTGYVETAQVPRLSLPLRVGIAFTPATLGARAGFTETEKNELARRVAADFAGLDFVSNIELIPSDYLRQGGSFANLDQLRQLFGIDVIVLLSYDQTLIVDQGFASLTYWTIVGAYVVPGEKNDTQTLMDAAVYDIASRKMLFRAPGTSVVKSRSTLVGNSEQLRADAIRGFREAGDELSANLAGELERFKLRVRENPQDFQVSTRPGYTGSSGVDGWVLALCILLVASHFARTRSKA